MGCSRDVEYNDVFVVVIVIGKCKSREEEQKVSDIAKQITFIRFHATK